MVAHLIGKDQFHRGMDKYFELYDGQAVRTEDFLHAMELASGHNLTQFRKTWYNQAGTPVIRVQLTKKSHNGLDLKVIQLTPTQKGQPTLLPTLSGGLLWPGWTTPRTKETDSFSKRRIF